MEGLQRSRYGTMAEGKKASKFSRALGIREESLFSLLLSLTSNTVTEKKPSYFPLQKKRQLPCSYLPHHHHSHTHPSVKLSPVPWCMGNEEMKLQVRSRGTWKQIVKMISFPDCTQLKRGKVPHKDLVIVFAKKKKSRILKKGKNQHRVTGITITDFRRLKWT